MDDAELLPNVTRNVYPDNNNRMACSPLFLFVWYTVIVGTTSLVGLVGNGLSIVVLQRDKGSKVANLLLKTLAIADICVLLASIGILSIIYGTLPYFKAYEILRSLVSPIRLYIQPIAYITKTCAIWMTVLLAVNRYVVIKRPLQAQNLCTQWKARLQVIAVVAFSVLFNIPRFLHYEMVTTQVGNVTRTRLQTTDIGKGTSAYTLYTNLFSAVVLLLPMVIVIVMNVGLICELRKVRHQRLRLSSARGAPIDSNITLVMCIIIFIFILCHTPDAIVQGIDSFHKGNWWKYSCYLEAVCNLLIAFNSSVNFFVYYCVRKKFRKTLYSMFCGKRRTTLIEPSTCVTDMELRYVFQRRLDCIGRCFHKVKEHPLSTRFRDTSSN